MSEYKKIPTSAEVYAVIHARHGNDMCVYSSYSAPDGDRFGNPEEAVMMTEYALKPADYPLIGCRSTWPVGNRNLTKHQYWLCVPLREEL